MGTRQERREEEAHRACDGVTEYFDSHCHVTAAAFRDDREAVLYRAREAGVTRVVTIASHVADARAAISLAESHEDLWCTAGVHPHEAGAAEPDAIEQVRELAAAPDVVAIGEGLDQRSMLVVSGKSGDDLTVDSHSGEFVGSTVSVTTISHENESIGQQRHRGVRSGESCQPSDIREVRDGKRTGRVAFEPTPNLVGSARVLDRRELGGHDNFAATARTARS